VADEVDRCRRLRRLSQQRRGGWKENSEEEKDGKAAAAQEGFRDHILQNDAKVVLTRSTRRKSLAGWVQRRFRVSALVLAVNNGSTAQSDRGTKCIDDHFGPD
jgi:hypothetical protein